MKSDKICQAQIVDVFRRLVNEFVISIGEVRIKEWWHTKSYGEQTHTKGVHVCHLAFNTAWDVCQHFWWHVPLGATVLVVPGAHLVTESEVA